MKLARGWKKICISKEQGKNMNFGMVFSTSAKKCPEVLIGIALLM